MDEQREATDEEIKLVELSSSLLNAWIARYHRAVRNAEFEKQQRESMEFKLAEALGKLAEVHQYAEGMLKEDADDIDALEVIDLIDTLE